MRSGLLKNPIFAFLTSLKLTVVCLFLLAVLVLLGTIDQVEYGLYLAQQRYFNSWFVPGLYIVPGARLVIWVLFINLVSVLCLRFRYRWSNLGLILSHTGLIVLMISAFMTLHFSEESFMQLKEAEQSNVASDYMLWELAVWKDGQEWIFKEKDLSVGNFVELRPVSKQSFEVQGAQKKVATAQKARVALGDKPDFQNESIDAHKVYVSSKYLNARYFDTPFAGRILKNLPVETDFEKNNRAVTLVVDNRELILEGQQESMAFMTIDHEQYVFELRRKQYTLPFAIQLLDVQRDLHPGTQKAKSYLSKVKLVEGDSKRKYTISMNQPFRSTAYTVYQSSYGIDLDGNEFTVLAIVKNHARLLPYISSLIISFGLFWHFGFAFFAYLRRRDA